MNLSRPSTPVPCSPRSYVTKKGEILARVRDAIQARRWECKDLHTVYPSIRRKSFEALMDGEDWQFSMRFACSVAESVGIDPWESKAPIVLPVPAAVPRFQAMPRRRFRELPGQMALELAA